MSCPHHGHPMLFDDDYYADPYVTYAAMREAGPVHRICLPDGEPVWLVTRFDDVRACLRDKNLVRNSRYSNTEHSKVIDSVVEQSGTLLSEDPPVHTRLRRFLNFAFAPKQIDLWRPHVHEVTDALLDAMAGRRQVDIMTALAGPLPIGIISEMLGVPEDARGEFLDWSNEILGGNVAESRAAAIRLLKLITGIIDDRRRAPGDDMISYWLTAVDPDGVGLTEQEVTGMAYLLLLGGFDTTVGTIGNLVVAVLSQPGAAARLRADPDLTPAAVEELIRWNNPALTTVRRFAKEDMTVGGTTIPAGDTVILSLASANRDPRRFDDPNRFDPDRGQEYNLGFGAGPHICPGKPLARVEVQVAVDKLLARFPDLTLAVPAEQISHRRSHFIRVPRAVPVLTSGR